MEIYLKYLQFNIFCFKTFRLNSCLHRKKNCTKFILKPVAIFFREYFILKRNKYLNIACNDGKMHTYKSILFHKNVVRFQMVFFLLRQINAYEIYTNLYINIQWAFELNWKLIQYRIIKKKKIVSTGMFKLNNLNIKVEYITCK